MYKLLPGVTTKPQRPVQLGGSEGVLGLSSEIKIFFSRTGWKCSKGTAWGCEDWRAEQQVVGRTRRESEDSHRKRGLSDINVHFAAA